MDQLIKQLLQGETFWYETTPAPPVGRSAFVPYANTPKIELRLQSAAGCTNGVSSGNANKRMIEFLRKSWLTTTETKDTQKERSFHHMMNERKRREKQKRSYFDLHSMLPLGTKNDKNSIVQTAIKRVQELEWLKKDLEGRNNELQATLAAMNENQHTEGTKIRVRIVNPKSGIDSMLAVLKCLKQLGSKPRMIQSKFTNQEFLAVIDIETEMGGAEVENAVNRTLQEAERKLQER
ncbi:transcription factor bHLH92-like isoform X2 [Durio zibethinus]|uniref:Transcription factor bHLH92-like isoform X2 n=1 Tax=Durio zibethinus TaxID=66656 RepID=A0A6P5X3F4_DURZI|nr:transcription factor bHLH92-like isoform X2 [Durio zibethinus]